MSEPPVRRRRRIPRVRDAVERVPTRWFAAILTGLFLVATAAFGSFADVPATATPSAEPGTVVEGAQFDIALDRAVLIDALPEVPVLPDRESDRLLVLVAEVENVFSEPLPSNRTGLLGALSVVGGDAALRAPEPIAVLRWDDVTALPVFQPGVPASVALVWQVDPAAIAAGDRIEIELIDRTFRREGFVTYGGVWEDERALAHVSLEVEDVGAGATETAP